jgi:hypothetical protein
MTHYILIREDSSLEHVTINDYRDMQDFVGGLITMPWEGPNLDGKATVVCNDEALLIGLNYNPAASALLGSPIYGAMLVGGATNEEGDIEDVTTEVHAIVQDSVKELMREANSLKAGFSTFLHA